MDNLTLVERFVKNNDEKAFSKIYEDNFEKVYRFIYARVGNKQVVEDLVSETFFTLLEVIKNYNGSSKLSTFIFGIAINKVRQYWQKREIVKEVDLDEEYYAAEDIYEEKEEEKDGRLSQILHEILSEIPEKLRNVLRERFIENHSIKVAANNLGVSDGNLRVLQNRALKKAKIIAERKLFNDKGNLNNQG
jgi:RNA polymerase sigma-70 factor, ECF subfamily